LGPIEPFGRSSRTVRRRHRTHLLLIGCAPVQVDAVDVGGDHQQVGLEFLRQQRGRQILVDDGLDALQLAVLVIHRGIATAAQTTITPASTSIRMGRISKMRLGFGLATTRRNLSPSGAIDHPPSAASLGGLLVVDRPIGLVGFWNAGSSVDLDHRQHGGQRLLEGQQVAQPVR
jgi:hypothetical protein